MSETKNTFAVLAIETDTAMLGIMQKLIFVIKRLNPGKVVELRIMNDALTIICDNRLVVNAIADDDLKLWHIAGASWMSQYIY